MRKFGYLGSKFLKTNVRFEISTFKIGYRQIFGKRLESWYFLAQNTQIWAFGLKVWKMKASRKFQITSILKFWVFLQFCLVVLDGFGLFRLVLDHFGWFRIVFTGFGLFWPISGFINYVFLGTFYLFSFDVAIVSFVFIWIFELLR